MELITPLVQESDGHQPRPLEMDSLRRVATMRFKTASIDEDIPIAFLSSVDATFT
jgi:hypothetical protein